MNWKENKNSYYFYCDKCGKLVFRVLGVAAIDIIEPDPFPEIYCRNCCVLNV